MHVPVPIHSHQDLIGKVISMRQICSSKLARRGGYDCLQSQFLTSLLFQNHYPVLLDKILSMKICNVMIGNHFPVACVVLVQ